MRYLEIFEDYINKDFGKYNKDNFIKNMNIMTLDECVKYVIENCNEFIDNPIKLVRNIYNSISYFQSEPVQRISRDNPNHYTLLIDNSEDWKEFPKRSKCFCCTLLTEQSIISNFHRYLVIPNDNSKWGVCPNDDLFYSFDKLNYYASNIKNFFLILNNISIKFELGGISDDNITDMKNDILKLQTKIFTKYDKESFISDINKEYPGFCAMLENQYSDEPFNFIIDYWDKNLFDTITDLISPTENNIKLQYYTDLKSTSHNFEVWTDSPCVFINFDHIEEVLKKLREITHKDIKL